MQSLILIFHSIQNFHWILLHPGQQVYAEESSEEQNQKQLSALASPIRLDDRKLSQLAQRMNSEGKELKWKTLASQQQDDNYAENQNYSNNLEEQLGLKQEHQGLESKLRDESVQY